MFRKGVAIKAAAISGTVVLLVYLRSLSCGFVNLDDPLYVLNNTHIRSLDYGFFSSVFTQTYLGWWMPMTWISLALDYRFWGLDPLGYHLTNVILHAVNTGLLVLIADMILKDEDYGWRGSYLYLATLLSAGLLWGVHPLRVESVVWVTERKDVLNGLFTFGAVYCYLCHVRGKERTGNRLFTSAYIAALFLFVLSLMAKSVSVVLPAALLVLDWYPLGRLQKTGLKVVLIEKLPFFVLAALMTVVTFFFFSTVNGLISNENFLLIERLLVSGNAFFEYCRLLCYPAGIVPLHFIPDPIPSSYTVKTVMAVVLIGLVMYPVRRKPVYTVVLLLFILPLLPVLAFFQNGDQAFASRFTYLPSAAPCIAVAALLTAAYGKVPVCRGWLRYALPGCFAALLLSYAVLTLRLIPVWNNPETMWNRVVEIEPSGIAFKERALLYASVGRYDAAVEDYSAALARPLNVWRPYIYNLYAFRGEALSLAGRYDDAVRDFSVAIAMFPHPVYYRLRGAALKAGGRLQEAGVDFGKAGGDTSPLDWYWNKIEPQK